MDLYFKAVPEFGDLNLDYVFFDEQYPILFTAVNKKNELFIVLNFETRGYQKWLISKTDYLNLMYMIYNQIPMVDVFKNDTHKKCIAVWDYTNKAMSYEIVEFANIDPIDLPASDFYFEADKEEIESFLNHFNAAVCSSDKLKFNRFFNISKL